MKNPKVAAEESMYWDIVCRGPLGPAPPLHHNSDVSSCSMAKGKKKEGGGDGPQNGESTEDESHAQSDGSLQRGDKAHQREWRPVEI